MIILPSSTPINQGMYPLETDLESSQYVYNAFSEYCTNTRTNLSHTAERIHLWATNPTSQVAFTYISIGITCGLIGLIDGLAYNNCLKIDAELCNKKTSRIYCYANTEETDCTPFTISYKDDLLSTTIISTIASGFFMGIGIVKLCTSH